jgi:hypothetical protein
VASNKAVEQAADELYGLPPGDFTSARDERAKELRGDDREAANAVKALRKPTVAAWALNQLARRRTKELKELLRAGEQLRSAQEKLLAGGDRSGFQSAAAAERDQVAKLTADALSLAAEAGERGAGLDQKIAATLHAAALDEETASELQAGRLTKEREAIGGFGGMELGAAAPSARPPANEPPASAPSVRKRPARGGKATGRGRSTDGSAKQRAATERNRAAAERDRAATERDRAAAERRERLAGARTDERHARRELDAATKALQHAEERAEAARAHAAEAAERAKKTAERLKEAKRAEAAARKAHTKATTELERAEGSDP